jgi:Sulfotransferase family
MAQCPDTPSSLVFIMGCHRSGTSLLYHLMAYTGQIDYLSAYDVIHYPELLHNRITKRERQVKADLQSVLQAESNRGLDELPVGVDLPEEYRFVLSKEPRRLLPNPRKEIDTLFFKPQLTLHTLDRFLEICRKKRFLAAADRTLVLKNPSDYYFNFRRVHDMLPAAKFIFIHRHPLPMLNSYLHGFRGILDQPSKYAALLDKRYQSLFSGLQLRRKLFQRVFRSNVVCRLLATRLTESFRYYLANLPEIPESQYVSIRYEDLCADVEACMARISGHLHLDLVPRISPRFVAPRRLPVPEQVRQHYASCVEDIRPYLEHCGYPVWPEAAGVPIAAHSTGTNRQTYVERLDA